MKNADAIARLEQIKQKYIHGGDEFFDAQRKEALDVAIAALSWRDFEKEKPEHGQAVIGADSAGEMETWYFDAEWPLCLCKYGGNIKAFNITHWMPLPEPPEEGAV